ncbi:SDR family NAD(P)-dependent oxidoreductase [Paenibacillus oceani]|uniref:SDR family oxidoreductase n=1 Tax=Paenibacillus oceani TaxID=2772510 RepID=A0A927H020_9BACL|nr:SDR family oxidoreductase [Paenibacillus oceani]MBD2862682.1 SDR family oxidoreductase [Paenibacillus oceani]
MYNQLESKVAIVTGGTKGIGGACTRLFAERGAKVVFTSRNAEEGRRFEAELTGLGYDCLYAQCDVLDPDDIAQLFEAAVQRYGKLDVLVNNAATHISKLMHDYTLDDFDCLIGTNLRNYFLHAKHAVPHLKRTKGAIVNIASSTGKVGQYAGSLYAATKGGIISFTKSIALDYARCPIRANAILPAYVDTPLLQSWIRQQENPAKTERTLAACHALGTISSSEEIAAVAAFLASDDASTVTGAIIDADGGATLEYSPAIIDFPAADAWREPS